MDDESKLIIRFYTLKVPIPWYYYLSTPMNSMDRNPEDMRYFKLYLKLLMKSLYSLSLAEGGKYLVKAARAYRGVMIQYSPFLKSKYEATMAGAEVEGVGPYSPGDRVTFPSLTSVSLDPSVVDGFSDKLYFLLEGVCGLDISSLSAYPREKELLLPPPCVFKVKELQIHCIDKSKGLSPDNRRICVILEQLQVKEQYWSHLPSGWCTCLPPLPSSISPPPALAVILPTFFNSYSIMYICAGIRG